MERSVCFFAFGAVLLGAVSVMAQEQSGGASSNSVQGYATATTLEAARTWLKGLNLTTEAETVEGGMIIRRGYLAESELDQSMLPKLQTTGLQNLIKLYEQDSGYRSPVEIAWFEPIDHPGTRCAALLQMVSLSPTPSAELRQALSDYRVKSPPVRLDAKCETLRHTDDQRATLGYFQGDEGQVSANLAVRCEGFRNGPKERLTITRRTAFAHEIKHNSARVSHAGNKNLDGAGRWTTIGLNAALNSRGLPYMTYLNEGFTVAWPSNVALVSYILDDDARCVALVAKQGSKTWVGMIEIPKDDQPSPAVSEADQGGWDAEKPLKLLGSELADALEYSIVDN
jgi:hypothetical protein